MLDRKIGKPPAVREIKITRDTEDLLRLAYDLYIFDGNSSSLIYANKYDGDDFVILNNSSEIIAFLVAAHAEFSQADGPSKISDIAVFTRNHFRQAAIDNIEVNFASPGHWRIIGATASLAAFVALGVAVFTSGQAASHLLNGIQVVNSVAPDDATAQQLQDSMNLLLRSIDKLELQSVLNSAKEAREQIGLNSSTRAQ